MTNPSLESRIQEAMRNPRNLGEMPDADAVGTVGNAGCGEMMRLWIKFKEERGKKVIDKATFQSFGCETAIAVASLATELIRGKTREEALEVKPDDLAPGLGPLPPMKIHCAELVQAALKSALDPAQAPPLDPVQTASTTQVQSLADKLQMGRSSGGRTITFLDPSPPTPSSPIH